MASADSGSLRLSREDEPELQLIVSLELVVELRESLSPSDGSRPVEGSGADKLEESGVSGGWVAETDGSGYGW